MQAASELKKPVMSVVPALAEASEELTNDMQPNHLAGARIQNDNSQNDHPVVE
jgi:hypothetical protein